MTNDDNKAQVWNEVLKLSRIHPAPLTLEADGFRNSDGLLHWFGGAENFYGATAATLIRLAELGVLDPARRVNDAPTGTEFIALLMKYPALYAGGYVLHPQRQQAGVYLDVLLAGSEAWPAWVDRPADPPYANEVDADVLDAVRDFARHADEIVVTARRVWCFWD